MRVDEMYRICIETTNSQLNNLDLRLKTLRKFCTLLLEAVRKLKKINSISIECLILGFENKVVRKASNSAILETLQVSLSEML